MPHTWDAIVVGAGLSGTRVAQILSEKGHAVLLLEAGPRLKPRDKAPEPDRRMWSFKAEGGSYDWYRVRAVGGRALLWGGWCYRFDDVAFERAGWPCTPAQMATAYRAVEKALGVVKGQVDERYERAAKELELRVLPKWGAHAGPGTAWTPVHLPAARKARTWQVAMSAERGAHGDVILKVRNLRTEKDQRIRARALILAASPLETTRILLRSDIGEAAAVVGKGFCDHMVASYVLLEPKPPPPPQGRGPFPGAALIPNFVNLDDNTSRPYPGGFSLELSGPVSLTSLGLERMVGGAEVEQWSATQIHAMGEVFPDARRYVDLHPELKDALSRPVPRVHVGWNEQDKAMAEDMKQACISVGDALAVEGSRLIPFVDPLIAGAGHEAGTCAMGVEDSRPCDANGRLKSWSQVWIADASAMPTSGDRHPTLTLLAHATRVAEGVARWLGGQKDGR